MQYAPIWTMTKTQFHTHTSPQHCYNDNRQKRCSFDYLVMCEEKNTSQVVKSSQFDCLLQDLIDIRILWIILKWKRVILVKISTDTIQSVRESSEACHQPFRLVTSITLIKPSSSGDSFRSNDCGKDSTRVTLLSRPVSCSRYLYEPAVIWYSVIRNHWEVEFAEA